MSRMPMRGTIDLHNLWRALPALFIAQALTGCSIEKVTPNEQCSPGQLGCIADKIRPVENCSKVATSGEPELDAAYAEVRSLHFYKYGDHPYCEATSHIMAHEGVVDRGIALKKLVISFRDPYAAACGREPEFAWHTVAALPDKSAAGGYLVLDPVYRCGIEPLADYLEWYVKTDCPEFASGFPGCDSISEEEWLSGTRGDPAATCLIMETPPWHYDVHNCSEDLGEPWDAARLARANSYVRTDLSGTSDYSSRPGASENDWGCNFGGNATPYGSTSEGAGAGTALP